MASGQFEGKVALVTGAASGIGEATARAFAAEGASVVVADVQDEMGQAVVEDIAGQVMREPVNTCWPWLQNGATMIAQPECAKRMK